MRQYKFRLLGMMVSMLFSSIAWAQDCQPSGKYADADGGANTIAIGDIYAGSAPSTIEFSANPPTTKGTATHYEWHFFNRQNPRSAFLIRHDENTEYTFTEAGTTRIVLYEILNGDTTRYNAISFSVNESSLQMPSAFSSNGGGINDIYRAKPGYKNIVEFKATISNHWGQKIYEWNDPTGGWDGKCKGKDVVQGVYFVNVAARGADDREFHIRRDVNLLRGYAQSTRWCWMDDRWWAMGGDE